MNSGNIVVLSDKKDAQVCTIDGKASRIRNGSTTPVKFVIFSWYSQYATYLGEPYWKEIFENASHDSFRKGYKFDGSILSIKIKNSIRRHNVLPLNPQNQQDFHLAYESTKQFMTETSGVSCHVDDNSVFVSNPSAKLEEKGWTGTTPAKYQIAMIIGFVNTMTSFYKLSEAKSRELKESIISMVYSGDITSEEIKCENFTISSIDCIQFIEGNFRIIEKPFKMPVPRKKRITSSSNNEIVDKNKYVFKCSKNLSAASRHAPIYA